MSEKSSGVISASLEDYLEAIHHLESANRVARAKDIADRMDVSRASVTGALKTLADRGLINYEPYSYITLTDQGRAVAHDVVRRHQALLDFFLNILKMDEEHSEQVACKVEHAIDNMAVDRLVSFLDAVKRCPRTNATWSHTISQVCDGGKDVSKCANCLGEFTSKASGSK